MARLLIVDDEADMRSFMKMVLERESHRCDLADSPAAAVDLMRMKTYDAVLMDVDMPGMDGIEFTRLVRENPRFVHYQNVPIIVVTGRTEPGVMGDAFDAGAVYFLQKPFAPRELVDTVRLVLHAGS